MFYISIRSKKFNVYETLEFYTREPALDYAFMLRHKLLEFPAGWQVVCPTLYNPISHYSLK